MLGITNKRDKIFNLFLTFDFTCSQFDTVDVCQDRYCHVPKIIVQNKNDDKIRQESQFYYVDATLTRVQLKSAGKIKFYVQL